MSTSIPYGNPNNYWSEDEYRKAVALATAQTPQERPALPSNYKPFEQAQFEARNGYEGNIIPFSNIEEQGRAEAGPTPQPYVPKPNLPTNYTPYEAQLRNEGYGQPQKTQPQQLPQQQLQPQPEQPTQIQTQTQTEQPEQPTEIPFPDKGYKGYKPTAEIQRQLGVSADGIRGSQTENAWFKQASDKQIDDFVALGEDAINQLTPQGFEALAARLTEKKQGLSDTPPTVNPDENTGVESEESDIRWYGSRGHDGELTQDNPTNMGSPNVNIDISEMRRQQERAEYEKNMREHPWLAFFLGPNKDEGWAEDHGIKYRNNIEHGWWLGKELQPNRMRWASQERYYDSPEDVARKKIQTQNVQRIDRLGSAMNEFLTAVRDNRYERNDEKFKEAYNNFAQAIAMLPNEGQYGIWKKMLQGKLQVAESTYWGKGQFANQITNRNFAESAAMYDNLLGMVTDMEGNPNQQALVYNEQDGKWHFRDEADKIAFFNMLDNSIDLIAKVTTGTGAVMADAQRVREIHKYLDEEGFMESKNALSQYLTGMANIYERAANFNSPYLKKRIDQIKQAAADVIDVGTNSEAKQKAVSVQKLLLDLGNDAKLKNDFQEALGPEEFSAAENALEAQYKAYLDALQYSGNLDVGAVLNSLRRAVITAGNAYNIMAHQQNLRQYKRKVPKFNGFKIDPSRTYTQGLEVKAPMHPLENRKPTKN